MEALVPVRAPAEVNLRDRIQAGRCVNIKQRG
jgi:hypothetical protein